MNKTYKQFLESLKEEEAEKLSQEKYFEELQNLKEENVISFNPISESRFIEGLCDLLDEFNDRLFKRLAINEMAYRIKVSPATTKRYLDKHTTTLARFEIINGMVRCKKHIHGKKPEIKIRKRPK